MSRPRYEIVKYQPCHRDQVLQLQTHLWGPNHRWNEQYLEWKYEQNPYVDTILIYLAIHDGEIVGMRGMYGTRWRIGDAPQELTFLGHGDTVVAPAHRGRGLFQEITMLALEDLARLGYRYLFNFSAGKPTYILSRRMGWLDVGPVGRIRWLASTGVTKRHLPGAGSGLPISVEAP